MRTLVSLSEELACALRRSCSAWDFEATLGIPSTVPASTMLGPEHDREPRVDATGEKISGYREP